MYRAIFVEIITQQGSNNLDIPYIGTMLPQIAYLLLKIN